MSDKQVCDGCHLTENQSLAVQPACDANHATSRRSWRLQERCSEHALIGGVTTQTKA